MDPIDRQAAIEAVVAWTVEDRPDIEMPTDLVGRIKALPSAQPEREKGEWIEFNSYDGNYDIIKCPYCKHIFTIDSYHWTDIGFVKDDFKFCPNCGERWKEEHETD